VKQEPCDSSGREERNLGRRGEDHKG